MTPKLLRNRRRERDKLLKKLEREDEFWCHMNSMKAHRLENAEIQEYYGSGDENIMINLIGIFVVGALCTILFSVIVITLNWMFG